MRDALVMWRNTKMVVLVALSAAIYAAILIPFKIITIVPGYTELRPGNAIPIVAGLLFGPAAAWGCAIGNLIADFFGTIGPGSFFGVIGNFLFAYIPYRIWVMCKGFRSPTGSWREVPLLVVAIFVGSAACAIVIAFGVELLALFPFAYVVLTSVITINNTLIGCILGIPLLILIYPRARRWQLTFSQVMPEDDLRGTRFAPVAATVILVACIIGVFAALDKAGIIANWADTLGMMHLQPEIGDDGKPLPVSLLIPADMALRQLGGWCSLAIFVGSFFMARVGPGRKTPDAVSEDETSAGSGGDMIMDQVTFTYPGALQPALKSASFSQAAGRRHFLMGRTGAGKSTLALCLNGVIPHMQAGEYSGSVLVGGLDTSQWPVSRLSRVTGLVFQDFETQLFCSDVELEVAFGLQNRGLPPDLMRKRVDYWLSELELEHLIGRDPSTLSGGEKQRLVLAAVMATEPPIVVLDEPTTDLDPAGRRQVMDAIGRLAEQGRTLLIATGHTAEAVEGDGLLVLHDGGVAYNGELARLLQDIEAAEALGLQPDPLAEIAAAVGLEEVPLDVASAVAMLRQRDARLDEESLRAEDAVRQSRNSGEIAISLEDVCFGYGKEHVLRDVSLQVAAGEFVAVLGPNGAGKTTMCKLMMGLLRGQAGTVSVNGRDIRDMRVSELAARIGYLYQNPDSQIFSDTVYAEVAFGPRNLGHDENEVGRRVSASLATTELGDCEGDDPFTLTRGQRQRVALAAILACEPDIIVFDKPTTGLDVPQQIAIMKLLKKLQAQGRTVMMVTHHTEMALQYADRLVLLVNGEVIADGPTREVVADTERFTAADQLPPAAAQIGAELFGVSVLSAAEFGRYVQLD